MTKRNAQWLLDTAFVLLMPLTSLVPRTDRAIDLLIWGLIMFRLFDRVIDWYEKELFDGR